MHHTGFLSAANKASKHDVTVDISAGAFSQWELSTVAGSSALTTASSIGRSFAGMASHLAAAACSRSVQFNNFGEQHADESGRVRFQSQANKAGMPCRRMHRVMHALS